MIKMNYLIVHCVAVGFLCCVVARYIPRPAAKELIDSTDYIVKYPTSYNGSVKKYEPSGNRIKNILKTKENEAKKIAPSLTVREIKNYKTTNNSSADKRKESIQIIEEDVEHHSEISSEKRLKHLVQSNNTNIMEPAMRIESPAEPSRDDTLSTLKDVKRTTAIPSVDKIRLSTLLVGASTEILTLSNQEEKDNFTTLSTKEDVKQTSSSISLDENDQSAAGTTTTTLSTSEEDSNFTTLSTQGNMKQSSSTEKIVVGKDKPSKTKLSMPDEISLNTKGEEQQPGVIPTDENFQSSRTTLATPEENKFTIFSTNENIELAGTKKIVLTGTTLVEEMDSYSTLNNQRDEDEMETTYVPRTKHTDLITFTTQRGLQTDTTMTGDKENSPREKSSLTASNMQQGKDQADTFLTAVTSSGMLSSYAVKNTPQKLDQSNPTPAGTTSGLNSGFIMTSTPQDMDHREKTSSSLTGKTSGTTKSFTTLRIQKDADQAQTISTGITAKTQYDVNRSPTLSIQDDIDQTRRTSPVTSEVTLEYNTPAALTGTTSGLTADFTKLITQQYIDQTSQIHLNGLSTTLNIDQTGPTFDTVTGTLPENQYSILSSVQGDQMGTSSSDEKKNTLTTFSTQQYDVKTSKTTSTLIGSTPNEKDIINTLSTEQDLYQTDTTPPAASEATTGAWESFSTLRTQVVDKSEATSSGITGKTPQDDVDSFSNLSNQDETNKIGTTSPGISEISPGEDTTSLIWTGTSSGEINSYGGEKTQQKLDQSSTTPPGTTSGLKAGFTKISTQQDMEQRDKTSSSLTGKTSGTTKSFTTLRIQKDADQAQTISTGITAKTQYDVNRSPTLSIQDDIDQTRRTSPVTSEVTLEYNTPAALTGTTSGLTADFTKLITQQYIDQTSQIHLNGLSTTLNIDQTGPTFDTVTGTLPENQYSILSSVQGDQMGTSSSDEKKNTLTTFSTQQYDVKTSKTTSTLIGSTPNEKDIINTLSTEQDLYQTDTTPPAASGTTIGTKDSLTTLNTEQYQFGSTSLHVTGGFTKLSTQLDRYKTVTSSGDTGITAEKQDSFTVINTQHDGSNLGISPGKKDSFTSMSTQSNVVRTETTPDDRANFGTLNTKKDNDQRSTPTSFTDGTTQQHKESYPPPNTQHHEGEDTTTLAATETTLSKSDSFTTLDTKLDIDHNGNTSLNDTGTTPGEHDMVTTLRAQPSLDETSKEFSDIPGTTLRKMDSFTTLRTQHNFELTHQTSSSGFSGTTQIGKENFKLCISR